MKESGRVQYETATDEDVIGTFFELSRTKGTIPALDYTDGLAYAMNIAKDLPEDKKLLVNISRWGDKNLN